MVSFLAVSLSGCDGESAERRAAEEVVRYLEEQRYGSATQLYRQRRDRVLSPRAAPVWRRALEHRDSTVRQWAVDALARIGREEDLPRLRERLDDPYQKVREAAVDGLIKLDRQSAIEALRGRLSVEEDVAVRISAARGLARLEDAGAAVPPLIEVVRDRSDDVALRQVAAGSLGRLDDPRAVDALIAVATAEAEEIAVRRAAAEALAMMSGPAAGEALERLGTSEDPYLRDLARRGGRSSGHRGSDAED